MAVIETTMRTAHLTPEPHKYLKCLKKCLQEKLIFDNLYIQL